MSETTPSLRRHVGLYRALLILYPLEFRAEYGTAMVQLFADQLRHRVGPASTGRVWSRTIRDLIRSAFFERLEEVMSHARFTVWLSLGMLAGAAALLVMLGAVDTDDPATTLTTLAIILAIEGGIVGLAYLYHRVVMRPTESAWRRSPIRHWWTALAGVIAAVYLAMGTAQLIEDPTSGNAVALAVFAGFTLLIASGLVVRAKRTGSVGTWLVAMGVVPGIGMFWFPPLAIACLLTLIVGIAEVLGHSREPRVRHSV